MISKGATVKIGTTTGIVTDRSYSGICFIHAEGFSFRKTEKDLEEVAPNPGIQTNHTITFGYTLESSMHTVYDDCLNFCMEFPKVLRHESFKTYYLGGYSLEESEEFIEWFNASYTFAKIEFIPQSSWGIVGYRSDMFGSSYFIDSGTTWNKGIYKISLKYPNKYVAKLLCVIIRTYFFGERYHYRKMLGTLPEGLIVNVLEEVIVGDAPYSDHYFELDNLDLRTAFDNLETWDYTNFTSEVCSQTEIYEDICVKGEW